MTASFFFESKTAGLMCFQHGCAQSCWAFFGVPREDAAAYYPCSHGNKKHPKLRLLHHGVLGSPIPLSNYNAGGASSLAAIVLAPAQCSEQLAAPDL